MTTMNDQIERRIVRDMLRKLAHAGFTPYLVNWGGLDDSCRTTTERGVLDAVFAVDDARVFFKGEGHPGGLWVLLVGGNGHDIISDFGSGSSAGFRLAMEKAIDAIGDAK